MKNFLFFIILRIHLASCMLYYYFSNVTEGNKFFKNLIIQEDSVEVTISNTGILKEPINITNVTFAWPSNPNTFKGTLKIILNEMQGFDVRVLQIFQANNGDFPYVTINPSQKIYPYHQINKNDFEQISTCDQILKRQFSSESSLDKSYKGLLSFINTLTVGKNFGKMCTFYFKDVEINKLELENMIDTFVKREVIYFERAESFKNLKLNSNVYIIDFVNAYNIRIDASLVNQDIFSSLTCICVSGQINMIDGSIFKSFAQINTLDLKLDGEQQFWHSSNNKWLSSLNVIALNESKMPATNLMFNLYLKKGIYQYPDEDICLFKHLNPKQLVKTELKLFDVSFPDPTCTLIHLYSNNLPEFKRQFVFKNSSFKNFSILCKNKSIEERCQHEQFLKLNFNFFKELTEKDLLYLFDTIEFIGPVLVLPIVSFIGFILNILVIIVILKYELYKKKETKDFYRLYKFMFLNSLFNSIECFLSIFKLMSVCIRIEYIFCSLIQNETAVQYIRIYAIEYIGESMKTSSILTAIGFSFERLLLTCHDDKFLWLKKLRNVKVRYVCLAIVIVAFGTSWNKLSEYHISYISFGIENPFFLLDLNNKPFVCIYFFHYIFNDAILFLVNLIIDILMVINVKKDVRLKKGVLSKQSKILTKLNKEKQIDSIKNISEDLNKMIYMSLMVFFICRLTELIIYMLFVTELKYSTPMLQLLLFFTDKKLSSISHFIYVFSYALNFFFYFKFFKDFRKSFIDFLFKKKRKQTNNYN